MTELKALTDVQLYEKAPSLFNVQRYEGVSEKYQVYPTINIVNLFQENGWIAVAAKQTRPHKKEKTPFVKHLVRLTHPEMPIYKNDVYGMVNIMNSHDGKMSYKIFLGMYRLVCSNGLVVGFDYFQEKLSHISHTFEYVKTLSENIMNYTSNLLQLSTSMRNISLTNNEAFDVAYKVLESSQVYNYHEKYYTRIAEEYIRPKRVVDESDDLWTRYNVIQEHMMEGVNYVDNEGKSHKLRGIRSVDSDIRMNMLLSNIISSYIH